MDYGGLSPMNGEVRTFFETGVLPSAQLCVCLESSGNM
jgi:hypothetical protein